MTIRLRSNYPMIMAFLQSTLQTRIDLSPHEMLAISKAISREFAPRFTRSELGCRNDLTFSAQELLAISQEISREFSPRPVENGSRLVLLPIDPGRLHAYWHLAEHNVNAVLKPVVDEQKSVSAEQKPVIDKQMILRVFKQSGRSDTSVNTTDKSEPASWFDIPITHAQSRQDIILPVEPVAIHATISAAIGISHGEQDFIALAYSNAAAVPNPTVNLENSSLPNIFTQFIIPNMNASSSLGKATSNPEIKGSR